MKRQKSIFLKIVEYSFKTFDVDIKHYITFKKESWMRAVNAAMNVYACTLNVYVYLSVKISRYRCIKRYKLELGSGTITTHNNKKLHFCDFPQI